MTALTARPRPITEAQWQEQVTKLAETLGYLWVHFRPAQTAHGWRTPVQGALGKGWPDLVLVHPRHGRVVFAELKREGETLSTEQTAVLLALSDAGADVHVWWPRDLERVAEVLR
jgi:hypothetical protein